MLSHILHHRVTTTSRMSFEHFIESGIDEGQRRIEPRRTTYGSRSLGL